nr:hypothetical protein [Tanacetum cinerariifolium]
EGNHNGSSSQQNKGHKVPRAHTAWPINKKAYAKNQQTRTCYECGSLRHYKSECPIVKFHKRVDMIHGGVRETKPKTMQDAIEIATKLINKKISTLVVRQAKNKRKLDNTSKNNQTNNNRTRDKILAELTLHGTRRRNITADLSRCVLNATITMMVHVLLNATSATELAIWLVTV